MLENRDNEIIALRGKVGSGIILLNVQIRKNYETIRPESISENTIHYSAAKVLIVS